MHYHQECECDGREHPLGVAAISEVRGVLRCCSAVVAQVDHRIGERLERVVHFTDVFEAQQQAAKLVFPGEDAFNGPEALLEDGRIEALPATALRCLAPTQVLADIRNHAAIEYRTAVGPAVVDAVQTDDGPLQVRTNGAGHGGEFR